MKFVAVTFVLLALAACTSGGPVASPEPPAASLEADRSPDGLLTVESLPMGSPTPAGCSVTVQFGSYADGTSDPTGIVEALRRDRRALRIDMIPWGREGERSYCVGTRTAADARALADGLRPLLAGPPGRRGFVLVLVGEHEVARTPPPAG